MTLLEITYGNKGCLEFTANLCQLVKDIPGAFCEAGVASGGQLVNMHLSDPERTVYAFDSFQGLAQHSDKDVEFTQAWGKSDGDPRKSSGITAIPLELCKSSMRHFISDLSKFVFVPGWFEDTLPQLTDEKFAIVRLDCDVYVSYKKCLECLYPRLESGGYIIFDDFAASGCKLAMEEYFKEILPNYKDLIVEDTFLQSAYMKKP